MSNQGEEWQPEEDQQGGEYVEEPPPQEESEEAEQPKEQGSKEGAESPSSKEEQARSAEPAKEEKEECEKPKESGDDTQTELSKICDPILRKNYIDYLDIAKQIERQNETLQEIKENIDQRCCSANRSECEEREIRVLKCMLARESNKLQCLTGHAIRMQAMDPDRKWKEIRITTSIDEDSMPTQMDMNMSKRLTTALCNRSDLCGGVKCDPCDPCEQSVQSAASGSSYSSQESMTKVEAPEEGPQDKVADFLRCLLKHGDKEEPNPCGKMDAAMIQKVLGRLTGGGEQTSYESPRSSRKVRVKSSVSDVSSRDKSIRDMKRKINRMQGEVGGLISKRERMMSGLDTDEDQGHDTNKSMKTLEKTINRMQKSVDFLKDKLKTVTKEKKPCRHGEGDSVDEIQILQTPIPLATSPRRVRANELKQLRTDYNELRLELSQKDAEINDLKKRMKPLILRAAAGTDNVREAMQTVEKSEVMVLRTKKNELEEEQEEFKCLIKEQAEQLDEYRRKYMESQQKYEEQKVIIGKMDMNNKRVEEQINAEVQRIKDKFQEKISELSQYPCILENEQLKLAQITKEKEDLEGKLKIICKELKALQAEKETVGNEEGRTTTSATAAPTPSAKSDCTEALRKSKADYAILERQHMMLLKERDQISEQLEKAKLDLTTLRTESAKIIARTRERSECTRQSLQDHVDKIEKELAQCRATACLSISDREEIIKEMTSQMNTLSFSFDAAQKQIKTLKTQIGFLSNESSYPVKM